MDLDALKLQLHNAETRINTLNAYSEDARKQGNALLMHQISQDLREVEGEAETVAGRDCAVSYADCVVVDHQGERVTQ